MDSRPGLEDHRMLTELELKHPNFDWTTKHKNAWNMEPIDQGSCGSCFSLAQTYAMQSRINIALLRMNVSEESMVRLSPQSVLQCSYYNQACEGGYPELVARHARDFGVPDESCAPYTGAGDDKTC